MQFTSEIEILKTGKYSEVQSILRDKFSEKRKAILAIPKTYQLTDGVVLSNTEGYFLALLAYKMNKSATNEKKRVLVNFAISLAIQQSIKEAYNLQAWIKWPYEMVIGDKLIGSLKIENVQHDLPNLLVRILTYINNVSPYKEKKTVSTSIKEILGYEVSKELFLENLAKHLNNYLSLIGKDQHSSIIDQYNENCVYKDAIVIVDKNKEYTCKGISLDGCLELYSLQDHLSLSISDSNRLQGIMTSFPF